MHGSRVNDILVFLAVVDAGSFIAGGKSLGLSRSTAGKAIARLEEGYGARLLNRTTRSLDLTEEGRRLYEQGVTIRDALAAADASVASLTGTPTGRLRIAAPDALGRRLILPVVYRFLELWPGTKVVMSLSDRVDNLVDGGFDVALRVATETADTSFISRKVWTDTSVLCAAPRYFEEYGRPTMVEQLTRHELLRFTSQGSHQGWNLRNENGEWVRAQGRVRLSLDSAEALRDAALRGFGIALLPFSLVRDDISSGRLERALPGIACEDVSIVALYPHVRRLEPRVRQFLDLLVDALKTRQPPVL